jgi:hypothetical protein
MNDYEAYRESSCNLPNYCTCLQCQYWVDEVEFCEVWK